MKDLRIQREGSRKEGLRSGTHWREVPTTRRSTNGEGSRGQSRTWGDNQKLGGGKGDVLAQPFDSFRGSASKQKLADGSRGKGGERVRMKM